MKILLLRTRPPTQQRHDHSEKANDDRVPPLSAFKFGLRLFFLSFLVAGDKPNALGTRKRRESVLSLYAFNKVITLKISIRLADIAAGELMPHRDFGEYLFVWPAL